MKKVGTGATKGWKSNWRKSETNGRASAITSSKESEDQEECVHEGTRLKVKAG